MLVPQPSVVFFDLFETLVTEIGLGLSIRETPASRLGIDEAIYRRTRRSYHHKGMTREVDYREILARACRAAGLELTDNIRSLIEEISADRVRNKAVPFGGIDGSVLDMLRQLRARG